MAAQLGQEGEVVGPRGAAHGGSGQPAGAPVLAAQGITKSFGAAAVLRDISLSVPPSSVLALVGENGAGKSTLIKIISGAVQADAGTIAIGDEPVELATPSDATAHGIATVYQELSLLPDMTVAENFVLGSYPRHAGVINWRRARGEADRFFRDLGLAIPVDAPVRQLGLAEQYLVEIAKAVRHRPSLLILDEPTAALDPHDSEQIFSLMDDLREAGTSMIFVSHRLDELFRCAQGYAVLRDGRLVAEGLMRDATHDELVANMLGFAGAEATRTRPAPVAPDDAPAIRRRPGFKVAGLATKGVRGVSFEVRPGEIVGIAGLRGSGQSDLCRALAGAEPLTAGEMFLAEKPYRPRTPAQALRQGVGFVPVDRKTQGLFLNLSVAQNVGTGAMLSRGSRVVSDAGERRLAEEYRDRLSIMLPEGRVDTPVTALSGGNQQKVVLAKCLAADPSVVVLSEPTRGVDIGAKQQIHELIRELAARELCVVLSSPELEELIGLCTSLIVLHRGEMVAELRGAAINEHDVLRFASGATD